MNRIARVVTRIMLVSVFGLLAFVAHSTDAYAGATLRVNTTADNNVCDEFLSLREAILLGQGRDHIGRYLTDGEKNQISNATFLPVFPTFSCPNVRWVVDAGLGYNNADNIVFDSSLTMISPSSELPRLGQNDNIDGDIGGGNKLILDGSSAANANGIVFYSTGGGSSSRILNLIIRNFPLSGIYAENARRAIFRGLDVHHNGLDGLQITGTLGSTSEPVENQIGGMAANLRNYFYANGRDGISLVPSSIYSTPLHEMGNIFENNYSGIGPDGGTGNGNGRHGIYLENVFGNTIGGDTAASRNVISGNQVDGIHLQGPFCSGNRIFNNFIGVSPDGNSRNGNTHGGIAVAGGAGTSPSGIGPTVIGDAGKGNVIAANNYGVGVFNSGTHKVWIRGNFIGTNPNNATGLGNNWIGVLVEDNASKTTIGGPNYDLGNLIAYNGDAGVAINAGVGSRISQNRIYRNNGPGIDLGRNGVTPNDPGDNDGGPNNLQNFPVITSTSSSGGNTFVNGTLNSAPNAIYTLEFFVNPSCHSSGHGEGRNHLASANVTTDANGNANFTTTLASGGVDYSGYYVTATATDAFDNTSEFSQCFRIPCSYSLSSTGQSFPASGGGGGFVVTTMAACEWIVQNNNPSWITITSGGSGFGNATINFAVAPNSGPARSGTLTISGLTFTINQPSGCQFSINPTAQSFPASGGAGAVTVTASASGCGWSAAVTRGFFFIWITSGSIGMGNGTVNFSVAANNGAARSGVITIGGKSFFVSQAGAIRRPPFDFDGDQKTDISVYRPSNATWYVLQSSNGALLAQQWGLNTDKLVPADYDGDGKTDIAVWRPSNGYWYILQSTAGYRELQFGQNGDVPMPADYDGDGRADPAVFRPANGTWYLQRSTAGFTNTTFGQNGDVPVAGDYDGDAKADVAVFRPSNSTWYIQQSTAGYTTVVYGATADKAVPGDYDGDGKTDVAVWRPSNGTWYLLRSSLGSTTLALGTNGDVVAPGDYDGDGKFDPTVFRPSNTYWYLQQTMLGYREHQFGTNGDRAIPSAFIP